MQLSEDKTYRTRDGSRTGIRVRGIRSQAGLSQFRWVEHEDTRERKDYAQYYLDDGRSVWSVESQLRPRDLIEEQPDAPQPFSYDACPTGPDGRKRAVTRGGQVVILICNDAPGDRPIVGLTQVGDALCLGAWRTNGLTYGTGVEAGSDLLIPPPAKRVVLVNLFDREDGLAATVHTSPADADKWSHKRLGNRAYPIEIDA